MIGAIGGETPLSAAVPATNESKKVREAASEFEALLIGQLLKSMRESDGSGWLGTGDDKASASLMEVAEQQFAKLMVAQGGLGLAALVAEGLPGQAPRALQDGGFQTKSGSGR